MQLATAMLTSVIGKVRNGLVCKLVHLPLTQQRVSTLLDVRPTALLLQARSMTDHADMPASKLSIDTISPLVKKAQYAVRGDIVVRAGQITKELKDGKKFPFEDVVMCNIGNPQSLGQKPITFYRQVLAICDYPQASPATTLYFEPGCFERWYATMCACIDHYHTCSC